MRRIILALTALTATAWAQNGTNAPKVDHASSYYYFALGHMYGEMAAGFGFRGDNVTRAIDNFKLALKADPGAREIADELAQFYLQAGRLREAQTDAEDALKGNPNDLPALRLLARVFAAQVQNPRTGQVDETMLRRALDQFQKIVTLDSKDADAFAMIGQLQLASRKPEEAENAFNKALAIDPEHDDALTGLASVYQTRGKNDQAAELLRKAAQKNPSPESLMKLAGAYEQAGEFSLAADTLRKVLSFDLRETSQLKHDLAALLIKAGRVDDALDTYKELVSDEPGDAQAYLGLSEIYRLRRNFALARETGDKAANIDPGNFQIRTNNIRILESEGKFDEAIRSAKSLLDSTGRRNYDPQQREERLRLLSYYAELNRTIDKPEEAVSAFRQIEDLSPERGAIAEGEVVETYRSARQYDKALSEAEAGIRKFPDDSALHIRHATVLADQGKIDPAVTEIRKTLAKRPERELNLALAEIYDKGRKWDDMAKVLDAAEKLSESDDDKSGVWFMRGAMFEKMKRYDQSEAEFRRILARDPGNVGALNYLGYMNANRNVKLDEALKLIQAAVEKEPDTGAYLDSLGWAYYRLGRFNDAEPVLREAALRTPRDPTVHDHLAEVLVKQSKNAEAVAQWELSLKEWELSPPSEMDQAEMNQVRTKLDNARKSLANGARR